MPKDPRQPVGRTDRELIESAGREADAASGASGPTLHIPSGASLPDWLKEDIPITSDSIPGYSIVREIHRGGQGVVYEAIQQTARRKVAIKVMREGPFAGKQDKARFEREVQVLAALKHPNIVAIHESGTVAGSFYFVMDYISGEPLDVYMAAGQRSVRETLTLFQKISEAVNAAHLRGVIHRDLKPGNIRIDGQGEPHILDFGLAKIAPGDIGEETVPMTMTGQFVGSLHWASPEQAEGVPDRIDIRTDVYSLGVILYRMLTGKFPYEVVGSVHEVLNRIITTPPARPSTVAAAARRGGVDNEIETIVLKALAKERERRYQSAGELARDIGHYLTGEPIEAKRDSTWYVLKKSLHRYRVPMVVAAALVATITGALLFSLHSWRRAIVDRDRAVRAERAAVASRDRATAEAAKARAADAFLQDTIASAGRERQLTGSQLLDNAIVRLDTGAFKEQPEVEAAIRTNIGLNYLSLSSYAEAEKQLRIALQIRRRIFGDENLDVAAGLNLLGYCFRLNFRNLPGAESCCREALSIERRLLGGAHPRVAQTLADLGAVLAARHRYADAEAVLLESLKIVHDSGRKEDEDTRSAASRALTGVYLACNQLEQAAEYSESSTLRDLQALMGQRVPQINNQALVDLIARMQRDDRATSSSILIPFMYRSFPKQYGPAVQAVLERLELTECLTLMYYFMLFSPDDLQCVFACCKRIDSAQRDQFNQTPDAPLLLGQVGRALVLAGEYQRGAQMLRDVAQTPGNPSPKGWWFWVGWAELCAGRLEAAREALAIAASGGDALLPPTEPANTAAAIAVYLSGNLDEQTLLQRSAPDLAYAFIAERHIMSGQVHEAKAAYEQCIQACKDSFWQWPANWARFRLKQLDGRLPGLPRPLPPENRIWAHPSTAPSSALPGDSVARARLAHP